MVIVSTSINKPTKATLKFAEIAKRKNWLFVMVGDLSSPHEDYLKLQKENSNFQYLTPDFQQKEYLKLSECIGWKTIQRRNIGFVHAYKTGAKSIATVDDDNVPYDSWGNNIFVNWGISVNVWDNTRVPSFDCYSITNHPEIWQRGYPLDYVRFRKENEYKGKEFREVLIQNDLPDGDPDIDSICRLTQKPIVKFDITEPYSTNQLAIFNSQNTILSSKCFPYYSVWPTLGRFDDLPGGLYLQQKLNIRPVFCPASVFQERNVQDLHTNLEKELVGFRYFRQFIESGCEPNIWPTGDKIQEFLNIYENSF